MKEWTSVLLSAAFLAGCSGVATEAPAGVARELGDVFITANVQPVGQDSRAGGLVRVVDLPGTEDMQVQVEATGLPAGGHAWHIHSGTCAQPGSIVVAFTTAGQMEGLDSPIQAGTDGRAEETAPLPASRLSEAQLRASSYSLHIHANPGMPPGAGIACADLRA